MFIIVIATRYYNLFVEILFFPKPSIKNDSKLAIIPQKFNNRFLFSILIYTLRPPNNGRILNNRLVIFSYKIRRRFRINIVTQLLRVCGTVTTVDTMNLHGNQGMLTSMWLDRPHSRMPAAPDRTNVASVATHKAT